MTATTSADAFPKGAVIAMGAVIALTIAGAGASRLAKLSAPVAPITAPASQAAVELRFADQADGSIAITEARTGAVVSTVAPDTGGFIRGVMRGLARDRMMRHIGQVAPFRLSRDGQGQLWLQDTATQRLIDLEAFGAGNRASFAALLPDGKARS